MKTVDGVCARHDEPQEDCDECPLTDADRRNALVEKLEDGLEHLDEMRERHGPHRDFDLVEAHTRRLIARVLDLRKPIPEELVP